MRTLLQMVLPAALAASFLIACGDDDATPDAGPLPDGAVSDAGPDAATADGAPPTPDAGPVGSCDDFTTPVETLSKFPAVYAGDLAGADSSLNISDDIHCTESDAPTGQVAAGPDQVVALTGLTPGQKYYVVLRSEEDLAVYVTTGCDAANPGPGADQCLAFADSQLSSSNEAQRFTAPADGKAFVVVDFWSGDDVPSPTTYELTVTTEGCATSEDCTDASMSTCDLGTRTCGATCNNDDAAEAGNDDLPAGATPVTFTDSTPVVIEAHVCRNDSATPAEADYYKLTVPDGGAVDVSLAWADTDADLDLTFLTENSTILGVSYWENPEKISMTFLPAGNYLVRVERFDPPSVESTPYTLTFTPRPTVACTSTASCAATFSNQLFRPTCNAQGACTTLVGAGAVAAGGLCDDNDDCASSVCGGTPFIASADTRSVCTANCTSDADCTTVGTGFKCTTFGQGNICLPPCTSDEQCPANLNTPPPAGQPWLHSTCTAGACGP